jgi:hypothetical protein
MLLVYMIINFKGCEISRGAPKLTWTSMLIKKKMQMLLVGKIKLVFVSPGFDRVTGSLGSFFFLYFCILKVYFAAKSVKLMFFLVFLDGFNTVMSKTIYFNVFLNKKKYFIIYMCPSCN